MAKILDTILKLFRLGESGRNTSEEEMLAAVTKARVLMIKHKISQQDVQDALNNQTLNERRVQININEYTAYTRKMRNLARYDEIVAMAIGELTDTRPILRHRFEYISMVFVGDERDTPLASELFLIWLPEVRRAARQMFGSQTWDKRHTSYAIGYSTRILDRAKDAKKNITPEDAPAMALVLVSTKEALDRHMNAMELKETKRRTQVEGSAYFLGYNDGGKFNMNTKVVR